MDLALDILALIIVDLLLFLMIVGLEESTLWELPHRLLRSDRMASPGRRSKARAGGR
ncbi:MAG: hypothetical protein RML36_12240 [Anaerolineae bacterium]|nr:hypothetical protein [Anaerolineae bacterium]MDW8100240.1 hypothetical protein [Anaerolineae bacterium]